MKVFDAPISEQVIHYFIEQINSISLLKQANQKIYDDFGLVTFFENEEEFSCFKEELLNPKNNIQEINRAVEYGDFQTNQELANQIVLHLSKNTFPQLIFEPTCGKGNFLMASLQHFSTLNYLVGIEIYKPYYWETKFKIIHFLLNNQLIRKPIISIIHADIFDIDLKKIIPSDVEFLVIGNPPWVTNATLGTINSVNLPKKTNFKNHNGLDAMTGKGNFDIAESIMLKLFDFFHKKKGKMALLVKNSVIKNIVFEQKQQNYFISSLQKYTIDSKKEFNVSVDASLFQCQFENKMEVMCQEMNFYHIEHQPIAFGWLEDKFVSNIDLYLKIKNIDGVCPFVWRQGLKHDCSKIMELDKVNGCYVNGLNEENVLEEELIYGLLKSSDLKNTVISTTRKYTIVTQKKVGQETSFIKEKYPKTYQYLVKNQEVFQQRKSSIYKNKPPFSIFGIGDYSFQPFKVAISGLYKTCHFSLIIPQNNKSIMLDDTCYLLGFDSLVYAVYTLILLNHSITKQFLESITFSDAKRIFTKDILMRIDLVQLINQLNQQQIEDELLKFNELYQLNVSMKDWENYIQYVNPQKNIQYNLF